MRDIEKHPPPLACLWEPEPEKDHKNSDSPSVLTVYKDGSTVT